MYGKGMNVVWQSCEHFSNMEPAHIVPSTYTKDAEQSVPDNLKVRDGWLDAARGLAILIVVFGHAIQSCNGMNPDNPIRNLIGMFQMPLLFLISGYTITLASKRNFLESLRRKCMRLLVPYLSWVLIVMLIQRIPIGRLGHEIVGSQFWFLRILFLIAIIFLVAQTVFRLLCTMPMINKWVGNCFSLLILMILTIAIAKIPGQCSVRSYMYFFLIGWLLGLLAGKRHILLACSSVGALAFLIFGGIYLIRGEYVSIMGSLALCGLCFVFFCSFVLCRSQFLGQFFRKIGKKHLADLCHPLVLVF